jgi:histidyl-tRNA synthetase
MKEEYKAVRGTQDYLPEKSLKLDFVEGNITKIADLMGFKQIQTPIFENTNLFMRSVGEDSDIVNKEMYTFLDKGGRSITLRPEGTAGVIRAVIENKMFVNADLPLKLFYKGPMFRYERPQKGRYRHFNQFGFESVGLKNPYLDAELLIMAESIIRSLGYKDINLQINTIGDNETREKYIIALKEYFQPHLQNLCEDCQRRIKTNPLRILDCKVDSNQEIFKNVPKISDYLSESSKEYFNSVVKILTSYQIPFVINETLVRGLDYYNDIVFEVHSTADNFKHFGALIGGGRYDNLLNDLGGPDLPCFGFAIGTDRLVQLLDEAGLLDFNYSIHAYIMPLDKKLLNESFDLLFYLRQNGLIAELDYEGRSIKAQFKTSEKKNAMFSILVGETEFKEEKVIVRDNETRTQETVSCNQILNYIDEKINAKHQGHHHCHEENCECEEHEHCHDENCKCQNK